MEAKYASKPDQLQAVLQHARTLWCPVRQTLLYEDVRYTRETTDEEERTEERKRKVEAAAKPQAKKKAASSSSMANGEEPWPET